MELKLVNDDQNKPQEQVRKPGTNPWDPPKGSSRQYNNQDLELDREPIQITNPVIIDDTRTGRGGSIHGDNVLLMISGIIVYCLFGIAICGMIWVTKQDVLMVNDNLNKIQSIFFMLELFAVIDAFIVFFTYEKKVSLLVFAFFLNGFYLLKRSKVVDSLRGIGAVITLGYFIGFISMFVYLFNGFSEYGDILTADTAVRQESYILFKQTTTNGKTYSSIINDYMEIKNATLEEQGGITYFGINGYGSINVDDSNTYTVGSKTVPTSLIFGKNKGSGQYKLCAVVVGDKQLTDYGVISYWKIMEGN